MTQRDGPDGSEHELDAAQRTALTDALQEGALDVFARADLAADAIDLAEAEAKVRRPRRWWLKPALSAAATLLVGVGLWALLSSGAPRDDEPVEEQDEVGEILPDPDGEPDGDVGEDPRVVASVASEREANVAYMNTPKVRALIAKVKPGRWIGIQHGKTMVVADHLGILNQQLKWAEREGKQEDVSRMPVLALHRFVFQKGSEGDKSYKTFFGKPPFVGAAFINRFMFEIAMGDGKVRYAYRKDGKLQGSVFEVPLREGKGAELPMTIGEPTSMAGLTYGVGYSTGSTNPLVLPNGMHFPRFEIPGTAKLEGGSDHPGTFRRCMASITIPVMGMREVFVEAMGNPSTLEQEDGSLRLGRQTWRPDSPAVRAEAAKAGKPVLLLERQRWMARYPGNPFAKLPQEGVAHALDDFVLVWRELPRRTTWVGGKHAVPMPESRLTISNPRGNDIVLRMMYVRPQTSKNELLAFLRVGLARFRKGPAKGLETIEANEADAVRALRAIHGAQKAFRAQAAVDADKDGKGEYGSLFELTGAHAGRMKSKLRPPLLPNSFVPKVGWGDLVLAGYRIRVFLPAHVKHEVYEIIPHKERDGRTGHAKRKVKPDPFVSSPAKDSANIDLDKAETNWWAYAWPESLDESGRRVFYIDQEGTVWAPEGWAGAYEGTAAPPRADAAFAQPQRYPGGVSPALRSADGNRWQRVEATKGR